MLLALITFAAETATEEEASHAAFYIAAGVLALWAVLVSALGIKRGDDFPNGAGTSKAIIAITGVLVVLACATSILTA